MFLPKRQSQNPEDDSLNIFTIAGLQVLTAVNMSSCRPASRNGVTRFQFKAVEGYIPLINLRRSSSHLERVYASLRSNMAEECATWLEPNRIKNVIWAKTDV